MWRNCFYPPPGCSWAWLIGDSINKSRRKGPPKGEYYALLSRRVKHSLCRTAKRMERPKTAIVIATKDRPEILAETLQSVRKQTWPAAHVYVSVSSLKDASFQHSAEKITILIGSP